MREPQFQRLKEYMSVPVITPFTSEDISLQKPGRSLQIAVGGRELNPVLLPLPAAVPHVASLLEQIKTDGVAWSVASDLVNALFLFSTRKENQKHFVLSWGQRQHTFMVCPRVTITLQTSDIL